VGGIGKDFKLDKDAGKKENLSEYHGKERMILMRKPIMRRQEEA